MARIALFLFILFTFVLFALASPSPVPVANGELVDIKKRTSAYTGRVSFFFLWHLPSFITDDHFPHRRELGITLVSTLPCFIPPINDRRILGLGNCGQSDNDNDLVLAIGKGLYDRNGGKNCGQV